MAGRVLRSSNGRFAGSTKGWGKGKKLTGKALRAKKVVRNVARNPIVRTALLNAAVLGGFVALGNGGAKGIAGGAALGASASIALNAMAKGYVKTSNMLESKYLGRKRRK